MAKDEQYSRPGPSMRIIGKTPTGAQDQGSEVDITNFAKVNTNLGPKVPIDSQMVSPFGKIPDGTKRDGIA
jgi:hypothetical protein